MSGHYNAFISYRHTPADSKTAREIQRKLEHFHIPRSLQKKYGISRIERVFRDESELLLTSDLTEEIKEALQASDYLIVICSPDTKESRWVEQEIRLFLETHDADHVLTVLSAGEPDDVVPALLKERKRTVLLEDGSETEITEPVEPLSCDYRTSFRKANRIELPRLVSAIIGCTYDELMQRRRQYQRRRFTIIASLIGTALAAFIVYLLWSRNQIQTNLNQSLINQSRYLSSSSLEAYDNCDRILAMELALAAMPDEGNERPLTAEAEYALSRSMGLYSAGSTLDYSAVRQYETEAVISDFLVSPDSDRMAVIDANDILSLIDPDTGEILEKRRYSSSLRILEGDEESFLLAAEDHLFSLSWKDGSERWSREVNYRGLKRDEDSGFFAMIEPDGITVFQADGSDNKTISSDDLPLLRSQATISGTKYFGNQDLLAIWYSAYWDDHETLAMYDLTSGQLLTLPEPFQRIDEVFFTESGNLLVLDCENSVWDRTYSFSGFSVLYDMTVSVISIDSKTGEERFRQSFDFTLGQDPVYDRMKTEDGNEYLILSLGNHQIILDSETGELIHSSEWPFEVEHVAYKSEDSVISVLKDGSFASVSSDAHDTVFRGLISDIQKSVQIRPDPEGNASFLVLQEESRRIIRFEHSLLSPGYTSLFPLGRKNILMTSSDDTHLAVYSLSDNDYEVCVYDLQDDSLIMTSVFERPVSGINFTSDGQLCVLLDVKGSHVGELISLPDSSPLEIVLPGELPEYSHAVTCQEKDNVYYAYTNGESMWFGTIDLLSEETSLHKTDAFSGMAVNDIWTLLEGRYLLIRCTPENDSESQLILADTASGETVTLKTVSSDPYFNPAYDSQRFVIRGENGIESYSYQGEQESVLPISSESIVSLALHDGHLYALSPENVITCYSLGGEMIRHYQGSSEHTDYKPHNSYAWDFSEDSLKLFASDTLQMFDLRGTGCRMFVDDIVAFDAPRNRVLARRSDYASDLEIGAFRIYSPMEMVEEAKRMLGTQTLSEEQKNRYGIGG